MLQQYFVRMGVNRDNLGKTIQLAIEVPIRENSSPEEKMIRILEECATVYSSHYKFINSTEVIIHTLTRID